VLGPREIPHAGHLLGILKVAAISLPPAVKMEASSTNATIMGIKPGANDRCGLHERIRHGVLGLPLVVEEEVGDFIAGFSSRLAPSAMPEIAHSLLLFGVLRVGCFPAAYGVA